MATLRGRVLGPDPGALSPAQLEQLRNFKIQTRIANEKYLRTHKEVELLISGFFRNSFQAEARCLDLAASGTAPVFSCEWFQDEPESVPHLCWILHTVLTVRKEEGRRGDRTLSSMPVLVCSAEKCF
ncbi:PREDICTED: RIIa domain-containing protein 1 isoform X2 [Galeopterus variegatus]|uniref:RIIa domain-containing protein 1 isoform X2 n=1 Tax=Galeopterus variegatus TaxID=482537 RepID=A0ABM0QYD0_GALVR|nr:PREDICTED: RIIa domain-containing protein 1 isoform X2 [Galeopterus variegatus]